MLSKNTTYSRTKRGQITRIYHNQVRVSIKRGHPSPSYTKEELISWVTSQDNYSLVFSDWETSGYAKDMKPSIDRLNDYLPYSFNNIRLTTWKINNKRGTNDVYNGINRKPCVAVKQFMEDGTTVEYRSISYAARENNFHQSSIVNCCRGNRKTAHGYRWEYA